MMRRTKREQKAYLDGYEMCAKCIEKYLSSEGRQKLDCLLMGVRNAVEMDDIAPQEQQPKTGRWIYDEILSKHYYCSECKSMGVDYWDYCPNCGAKMIESEG